MTSSPQPDEFVGGLMLRKAPNPLRTALSPKGYC